MPEDKPATPVLPGPTAQQRPGSARRWFLAFLGLAAISAIAAVVWFEPHKPRGASQAGKGQEREPDALGAIHVEVVTPNRSGLGRRVVQPGTILAFDKASLYAKVSGYLVRQRVDIGDRVKKGDVLAEVDVPEVFKSRDQAAAALGQAKAKAKVAEAKVLTFQADRQAAEATVAEAEADLAKYTADRVFRYKERNRIADLVQRKAVQQEILDERQKEYDAALAAERTGNAAIASAKAAVAAADARVAQARADVEQAEADIASAQADLAKSEVFVDYTKIVSPYDGVITRRDFHDGDFIRSAADGGTSPILAVARTDLMRVVVMVPDLDVPYVRRGEPATIAVDALAGKVFRGKVARYANSETELKLMRTEIDLPNPDDQLRDGMYGTATIEVAPPSKNLSVPSTCLIEQDDQGSGSVYVVRAGKIHRQAVRVAKDDGQNVEITEGLSPENQVVVRYNGAISEGLAAEATPIK